MHLINVKNYHFHFSSPAPIINGDSVVNLNLNGAASQLKDNNSNVPQLEVPPAPAISVVTFRWDTVKMNRGEPDR